MAGSAVIGSLRVNLGIDTAAFADGLKSARKNMQQAGRQMQRVGAVMSAGITAPLAILGKQSLDAFNTQEAAMVKVRQAIESTGGAAGKTADQLFDAASAMQEMTRFGDEDILNNVTAQLLTFTNIADENFDRAQQAVLDLATVLDGDLKGATIQLGKALNAPTQNLSALSRAGIQFSDQQRDVIKSLVASGQLAEAQGIILDELTKQYGGQAAAAAETFGGKQQQLANAFGDLKEQIGAVLADVMPPLVDGLKTVIDRLQSVTPETRAWAVGLVAAAAALGPAIGGVGLLVSGLAALSWPVAVAGAAIVGFGVVLFDMRDELRETWESAKEWAREIGAAIDRVVPGFETMRDDVLGIVDDMWAGIRSKFSFGLADIGKLLLEDVKTLVNPWRLIRRGTEREMEGMQDELVGNSIIPDTVDSILEEWERLDAGLGPKTRGITSGITSQFQDMASGILDPLKRTLA